MTFQTHGDPDILWNFGALRKWLRIIVKYSDPYGTDRETGYMIEVQGASVTAMTDDQYTYER
jgi:hypothetical protein